MRIKEKRDLGVEALVVYSELQLDKNDHRETSRAPVESTADFAHDD